MASVNRDWEDVLDQLNSQKWQKIVETGHSIDNEEIESDTGSDKSKDLIPIPFFLQLVSTSQKLYSLPKSCTSWEMNVQEMNLQRAVQI